MVSREFLGNPGMKKEGEIVRDNGSPESQDGSLTFVLVSPFLIS